MLALNLKWPSVFCFFFDSDVCLWNVVLVTCEDTWNKDIQACRPCVLLRGMRKSQQPNFFNCSIWCHSLAAVYSRYKPDMCVSSDGRVCVFVRACACVCCTDWALPFRCGFVLTLPPTVSSVLFSCSVKQLQRPNRRLVKSLLSVNNFSPRLCLNFQPVLGFIILSFSPLIIWELKGLFQWIILINKKWAYQPHFDTALLCTPLLVTLNVSFPEMQNWAVLNRLQSSFMDLTFD